MAVMKPRAKGAVQFQFQFQFVYSQPIRIEAEKEGPQLGGEMSRLGSEHIQTRTVAEAARNQVIVVQ